MGHDHHLQHGNGERALSAQHREGRQELLPDAAHQRQRGRAVTCQGHRRTAGRRTATNHGGLSKWRLQGICGRESFCHRF